MLYLKYYNDELENVDTLKIRDNVAKMINSRL